jgi:DNA-directed RNA polymerase sigma subunit (sigma70/sigma32)
MAIQGHRCRCKTWNISLQAKWATVPAGRKIQVMAARSQPDEVNDANGSGPYADDVAALRQLVREVRLSRPLEAGEREKLLERSALGDSASQERLVAANLDMVIRLASARADQGLSVEDLVQEGSIGLVEAVRSFTIGAVTDFMPFAEEKVGAYMDAAIAAESASVRDAQLLVAAATDYERAEATMRHELLREPIITELAEKLEWSVDRTRYVSQVVADARRRHDEELLAFIDPGAVDFGVDENEPAGLDG